MAVNILTNPNSNIVDPGIDIDDPVVLAAKIERHRKRHDMDHKEDPENVASIPDPQWSIPPISSASPPAMVDQSLSLEMGVVYDIRPGGDTLFQNIAENENDKVEYSTHGDAEGTWARLNAGSMIRTSSRFFLLNRTNFENLRIAVIESATAI